MSLAIIRPHLDSATVGYFSRIGGLDVDPGRAGGPQRRRAFDYFSGIVGKGNDEATPYLMEWSTLRLRTYNIQGEQHAFHEAADAGHGVCEPGWGAGRRGAAALGGRGGRLRGPAADGGAQTPLGVYAGLGW